MRRGGVIGSKAGRGFGFRMNVAGSTFAFGQMTKVNFSDSITNVEGLVLRELKHEPLDCERGRGGMFSVECA